MQCLSVRSFGDLNPVARSRQLLSGSQFSTGRERQGSPPISGGVELELQHPLQQGQSRCREVVMNAEALDKLLLKICDSRLRAMIWVVLLEGAKRTSLLHLKPSDVTVDHRGRHLLGERLVDRRTWEIVRGVCGSGDGSLWGPFISPWTVRRHLDRASKQAGIGRVRMTQLRYVSREVVDQVWRAWKERPSFFEGCQC